MLDRKRTTEAATITIFVPGPLRDFGGGSGELLITAGTVRAALEELESSHPRLHRSVCDETGRLRRHVNLFVNADNIRDLAGFDTPLVGGDVLTIFPAVSGG